MASIKILDCTLREAPIENQMWGELYIRKILHRLEKAGVDIIEIGFLKNSKHVSGSTSFQFVEEIEPYIDRKKNPDQWYSALVDYGRYDLKYLSEHTGKSVDMIRVCFKHNEMDQVLDYAKQIKEKGYKVCIQHVDTMGFTDQEIIPFIGEVNKLKPYSYSIVDTFGSMYEHDMLHFLTLADVFLDKDIQLGFHGHNNLMMADANLQTFVRKLSGKRDIIGDASLLGCGRGAGNAHTELIAEYLIKNYGMNYDIDEIFDVIDSVIYVIQKQVTWGYGIPYLISGIHNAHSFNVKQLLHRHIIKSKDLRAIIEQLDEVQKKKYDYALLEKLYIEHFNHPYDDVKSIEKLTKELTGRMVLVIGPAMSAIKEKTHIDTFIDTKKPIVVALNNYIEGYHADYIFFSGIRRYQNLQYYNREQLGATQIIVTSNIKTQPLDNETVVDYTSLIKYGWINLDSSFILLLRLLIKCGVSEINITGVDGYKNNEDAYFRSDYEVNLETEDKVEITKDNRSMLEDIRKHYPDLPIHFITDSLYKTVFE